MNKEMTMNPRTKLIGAIEAFVTVTVAGYFALATLATALPALVA